MSNEQREQQMMADAEAYAAEIYKDEPDNFHTDEQLCGVINDFCAGWRAADQHPHWIPVEKRLPEENQIVWIFTSDGKAGIARYDKYGFNVSALLLQVNVTHWMEIVPPRKEE